MLAYCNSRTYCINFLIVCVFLYSSHCLPYRSELAPGYCGVGKFGIYSTRGGSYAKGTKTTRPDGLKIYHIIQVFPPMKLINTRGI